MNALLIPFFLSVRLLLPEEELSTWTNGPEYKFHVQVNNTAIDDQSQDGSSVRLNLTGKLICQPKGSSSKILTCRFEDTTAETYETRSTNPVERALPIGPIVRKSQYEPDRDEFDINFDQNGIASLLVNEHMNPRKLEIIRVIVDQLNIGAKVNDFREGIFQLTENFTKGECNTTYNFNYKTIDRDLKPTTKPYYTLVPHFGLKDGQMIEILKVRDMDQCKRKESYFFGSVEGFLGNSDVISDLKSSDSRIIITSNEFTSSTSNVIATGRKHDYPKHTLYENINLRLESIEAATDPPEPVKNAELAGMLAHRWLIDDSSEEASQ